jgi:excisionase family DNA binding protein
MNLSNKTHYNTPLDSYNSSRDGNVSISTLFENLIWLTTKETAVYLRRSVNSIHTLVSRRQLRARKFRNRLYFKRTELDHLIETSQFRGG